MPSNRAFQMQHAGLIRPPRKFRPGGGADATQAWNLLPQRENSSFNSTNPSVLPTTSSQLSLLLQYTATPSRPLIARIKKCEITRRSQPISVSSPVHGEPTFYLTVASLLDNPHGGLHFFPHPPRGLGRLKQVNGLAQPQDLLVRVAEL